MKPPIATYRLQLHPKFTFEDAQKQIPYLKSLGIEMVYFSPFFLTEKEYKNPYKAVSYSRVDPRLGGEKAFLSCMRALKKAGIFCMVDFVPNHMGASVENPWYKDVLKKEKKSPYAKFFDIHWKTKNYRRFFDITDLIGLHVEKKEVFQAIHKTLFSWIEKGLVQAIRVDHIDGLWDPLDYLQKIHKKVKNSWIFVEKILQKKESIPSQWPVSGTVGYESLNQINDLFVDHQQKKTFLDIYQDFTHKKTSPQKMLVEIKRNWIKEYFPKEIEFLNDLFYRVDQQRFSLDLWKDILVHFLSRLSVYRTYATKTDFPKACKIAVIEALDKDSLLKKLPLKKIFFSQPYRKAFMQLQQYMPAVFAKGFEDTFLYQFVPMSALNEVGSTPWSFGSRVQEFHAFCIQQQKKHPLSLNTTSTHDTKRSLDVRMRISALTEIPDQWKRFLKLARKTFGPLFCANTEYLLYQTLLGFWSQNPNIEKRLSDYMIKASREAKTWTKWTKPNLAEEKQLRSFIQKVFQLSQKSDFWKSFYQIHKKITKLGQYKSLSATVLQMTMPGIPDFYQGNEFFRYDLVDPDNRRKVDFFKRKQALSTHQNQKLLVIHKLLQFRKQYRDLFTKGSYKKIPMKDQSFVAFQRSYRNQVCIVVVQRLFSKKNLPQFLKHKKLFPNNLPFQIYY